MPQLCVYPVHVPCDFAIATRAGEWGWGVRRIAAEAASKVVNVIYASAQQVPGYRTLLLAAAK